MQALGIRHRRVLGVLHPDDDHADAPSERHLQNGPGLGPERCGGPSAEGLWRERIASDRLLCHAHDHGRSHSRARVHDRRKRRRSSEVVLVDAQRTTKCCCGKSVGRTGWSSSPAVVTIY